MPIAFDRLYVLAAEQSVVGLISAGFEAHLRHKGDKTDSTSFYEKSVFIRRKESKD